MNARETQGRVLPARPSSAGVPECDAHPICTQQQQPVIPVQVRVILTPEAFGKGFNLSGLSWLAILVQAANTWTYEQGAEPLQLVKHEGLTRKGQGM